MVNNIEDRPDNATRFLVVGRKLLAASGKDKTTILVSTSDTAGGAGVLHTLLQPLAENGVSMTRIESRPSRRQNWDYVFFIDIEGHAEEAPWQRRWQNSRRTARCFECWAPIPRPLADRHMLMRFKVTPSQVQNATVTVPGDKSVSHRALMLGSIAEGRTEVSGFLAGEDCLATLAAMRALGVRIEQPSATEMVIEGVGLNGLQGT